MKTDGSPIESLLPPGPIASPGLAAIDAVLNPAQTPYLYFQACEGDQYHTFSTTYEDHAVACP
jgi:UPF0755 protein